jgi:lipoprotein-releasing system permease protein
MSRLPFEAFLALRYLRPRRTFVSVITVISIIGVLLGVAVLIVVIAVMSGFDQEWRDRILGFNAHLKVSTVDNNVVDYEKVMKKVAATPGVTGVAPFVMGQVLLRTEPDSGKSRSAAPIVFGIDPDVEGNVSVLPKSLQSGNFDLSDRGLVIGCDFARELGLNVGDRVAIYSPASLEKMERNAGKTNAEVVLAEDYIVRGIFDVGFPDYNGLLIVSSLENARELQGITNEAVQGLKVKLTDPFQAAAIAVKLRAELKDDYTVLTWQEDSPAIFSALAVEKNMMFFLLFFIMLVAAFGIVSCQITFVVQKTREIGILKALGATRRQILWLFLSQSVVVGVLGVGLGFALALLALHYRNEFLEFMRHATGSKLLPSSIYMVYQLPASLQAGDVTVICGTAFITCVLAGLFPALKASRLQPVEALRYE